MLKILKHLKTKEWIFIGISLVFIVAQVWLDLKMPEYMSAITKLVQTESSAMSDVWKNGGYMLLCCLGSLAAAIAVGFLAARVGAAFARRIRSEMFNKVDSFSMGEINKFSTSSLVTRSTNDVTQVQMLVTMGLQMIIKAPILAVWAIFKISGKGFEWTAATGITVVVMILMMVAILLLVMPKFKKMQTLTDNLNRVTRENLTGLPVVRAYNAEHYQEGKFEKANKEFADTQLFTNRAMAVMQPAGETIAFIGSTGSGKSTLINLVPRFYDATEGEILIDGVNVRDYTLDTLYDKIGYISQKAVMFDGTVASNVAFGERADIPALEMDVKDAVRIAQGTEFVEKMETTYDAPIARGGGNVSGGQKQRLSIARAIWKQPEILIFDDSFSALDYKTDRELRTTLKNETSGVTNMIVAQRIGTIMDADKIVVLDEGKIVGIGKHKELLKTCAVYKEIAMSQLSEEELAV